jgi:hypothetical protein
MIASSTAWAVPVVNRRDPRALRSALMADAAHGGGRWTGDALHFFAPFGGLPSAAVVETGAVGSVASPDLSLRIEAVKCRAATETQ